MANKQYDNTNRGALFKNKDKEKDEHPDYTGKLNVLGKDYWLAAWIKESKGGMKYMSLSVKPADPEHENQDEQDSDVPF